MLSFIDLAMGWDPRINELADELRGWRSWRNTSTPIQHTEPCIQPLRWRSYNIVLDSSVIRAEWRETMKNLNIREAIERRKCQRIQIALKGSSLFAHGEIVKMMQDALDTYQKTHRQLKPRENGGRPNSRAEPPERVGWGCHWSCKWEFPRGFAPPLSWASTMHSLCVHVLLFSRFVLCPCGPGTCDLARKFGRTIISYRVKRNFIIQISRRRTHRYSMSHSDRSKLNNKMWLILKPTYTHASLFSTSLYICT